MVAPKKRTNVRSPYSGYPDELRALAALFFRPRKRLEAEPWDASWTPHVLAYGDLELRGWSRGAGRSVLLVHGWEGGAAQLRPLGERLNSLGLRTVAFDLPAHGASSGDWASLPRFADALRMIAQHHGPFHAVVAHSLGAPAAVLALSELRAQKLALIAPAAEPTTFIRGFGAALELPDHAIPALVEAIERHLGWRVEELEAPPRLKQSEAEVLVLHDPADREVPFAHGRAIAEAAPRGRLVELAGAGHRRIASDPRTLAAIAEFLGPA